MCAREGQAQPAREADSSRSDAESCKCAEEQEDWLCSEGAGEENGGVGPPPKDLQRICSVHPSCIVLAPGETGQRRPGLALINSAPLSVPWQLLLWGEWVRGQGDLVQGLRGEDGGGGGRASQLGGDRSCSMVASVQDEGLAGVGTTGVPSSLEDGEGWGWQAQCG